VVVGDIPLVPTAIYMGHTIRDGPAHKNQDVRCTALVGVHRKASRRYLEDRDISDQIFIDIVIQIEYLLYNRLGYFLYNSTPPEYIRRSRGPLVNSEIQIPSLA
jgi:hypothetical protein